MLDCATTYLPNGRIHNYFKIYKLEIIVCFVLYCNLHNTVLVYDCHGDIIYMCSTDKCATFIKIRNEQPATVALCMNNHIYQNDNRIQESYCANGH